MKTLIISLLFVCSVFADELRDGNWWARVPIESRAPYVCGMLDGIFVGGQITKNQEAQNQAAKVLRGKTVQFWIQKLDEFYAKPENMDVSVIDALAIQTHSFE